MRVCCFPYQVQRRIAHERASTGTSGQNLRPDRTEMKRALYWFRRDLRVSDNTALHHACNQADEIIPVYILSSWKRNHRWTGPNRQAFLCGCLESLEQNLGRIGGRLLLRSGPPVKQLVQLAQETGAGAIYFNQNYGPYDLEVENQLRQAAKGAGIETFAFKDTVILAPNEVLNQSGQPFRVFTPYAKAWHQRKKPAPLPKVEKMKTPGAFVSEPIPTLDYWGLQPEAKILQPGEKAAHDRLRIFLKQAVFQYASNRNELSLPATSRLSQDLRFGTISPREVYTACQKVATECTQSEKRGLSAFMNELVWREFYFQILWHFPKVLDEDFNGQFSKVRWDTDSTKLERWCEGTTGFPIVDAAMRELNATGHMHNRARMIVAMFLTKDLHIHWREGERYFMQKLVDGDIAANNGGWQWSAGTGADAAPYFRIQNPWTQTKTYDSQGDYIKRWVPELKAVDPAQFAKAPSEKLVPDYPLPIVDHAKEREITLQRFRDSLLR
jgi:deoxyribodipyrimidine photo-lyase